MLDAIACHARDHVIPKKEIDHARPIGKTTNPEEKEVNLTSMLFSFQGRVNRQIWWASFVLGTFVIAVCSFIDLCITAKGQFSCLTLIAVVIIGWPALAVQVKRFHDRNKSGWWSLIGLVPYVGSLWIIVELGFFGPVNEGNRY